MDDDDRHGRGTFADAASNKRHRSPSDLANTTAPKRKPQTNQRKFVTDRAETYQEVFRHKKEKGQPPSPIEYECQSGSNKVNFDARQHEIIEVVYQANIAADHLRVESTPGQCYNMRTGKPVIPKNEAPHKGKGKPNKGKPQHKGASLNLLHKQNLTFLNDGHETDRQFRKDPNKFITKDAAQYLRFYTSMTHAQHKKLGRKTPQEENSRHYEFLPNKKKSCHLVRIMLAETIVYHASTTIAGFKRSQGCDNRVIGGSIQISQINANHPQGMVSHTKW
jgi:hypothetical protein